MSDRFPRRPSEPGPAEKRATVRAMVAGRLLIGFVIISTLALMAGMGVGIYLIREGQKEAAARGKDIQSTQARVYDCTDPSGKCYQRGQEQTAGAVDSITDATVRASAYAAACADRPGVQGPDEIFACVVRKFADADQKP